MRPPQHRLERSVTTLWILQALVFPGLLLAGSIVAYVLWEAARPWLIAAIIISALGTLVSVAVEPWWRFAVHRWEVTDEAVYARSGWVVKEWRVAPISRIQTVDSVRGPFEQLLGLATLRVTTASSSGAIEINGLDADVAADVAERLTLITERTPGDAT
ncbi:PH domain-containing protein [Pseudactinotalea sp. Z1739]|uniref:PH domain-containing protein n=1 Tax=Pseudactinotalea sp. Z1739 TaxID=3413028 RepID=UPI003C7DF38F